MEAFLHFEILEHIMKICYFWPRECQFTLFLNLISIVTVHNVSWLSCNILKRTSGLNLNNPIDGTLKPAFSEEKIPSITTFKNCWDMKATSSSKGPTHIS